ncbi:MAG: hypothetical protein Fur0043_20900 [Anaerolineales bacterium]
MMFFMWLFPLLFVFLLVYLLSGERLSQAFRPAPARACASCHRAAQDDWKTCPYCGQTL